MHMPAKNEYMREVLPRYLQADKHGKTNILDELCATLGYRRKYAIWKLKDMQRKSPAEREGCQRRRRKKTYGTECVPPLKQIWEFLEYPCGERLQPYLPTIIPLLETHGELAVAPGVRQKLLAMSRATIDRLLEKQRRVRRRKAQSTTRAGTLLKTQIPVRHELWPEDTVPGYEELDLVAHCGIANAGDYVSTLSVIDIATTWIEHAAILGKSKQRTVAALDEAAQRLPFRLRGIDPDNDGQFINYFLYDWCTNRPEPVEFTRSRAYKKNDNAHVEQKNWSTVRRVFGYVRLETERQHRLLQQLYAGPLRDWQNFFQPTLKLAEKERRGSRVIKRHDTARTPYQRVLDNPHVPEERTQALRAYYATLNPVTIKRKVDRLITEIFKKP